MKIVVTYSLEVNMSIKVMVTYCSKVTYSPRSWTSQSAPRKPLDLPRSAPGSESWGALGDPQGATILRALKLEIQQKP